MNLNSLKFKILPWIGALFYAGLIFYLSSQPNLGPDIDIPFLDKFIHIVEYAILAILLLWAFFNSGFNFDRQSIISLAIIIAFIYGISDEIHQAFVPGRSADIFDAIFDLIGASLGAYFYPLKI